MMCLCVGVFIQLIYHASMLPEPVNHSTAVILAAPILAILYELGW